MRSYSWPNLTTMFFAKAKEKESKPFLWVKDGGKYCPITWTQTANNICAIAQSLLAENVKPKDRIVLVSENRPEWLIADLAIMSIGAITVPAYITNTPEDHLHILRDSSAIGVIVSNTNLTQKIITAAKKCECIRFIISMESLEKIKTENLRLKYWNNMLASQQSSTSDDICAMAGTWAYDDTACIIYTSGTGGNPKGVMLSHRNLLHNVEGAKGILNDLGLEDNIFLSFLPLSHSYEHMAGQFFPISIGAEIYYAEGIESLAKNMQEARPTIMTAVPRLYETMYQRIKTGIRKNGGFKEILFNKTCQLGRKRYEKNVDFGLFEMFQDKVLDKLVRQKVRNRFGGRLKALVSGGAPLNPEIGIFFTSLGLKILQGYGQTETAPLISANLPSDPKMHTVGPPVRGTEVKIANDGEILVRGDLVMQGYWRNEKATKEVIRDGWIHTGDIGILEENGHLQITDRKKDIIVNSGGDNISPQRIEGLLSLEPEITQAAVFGDRQPHLVALLVVDQTWKNSLDKDPKTALQPVVDRVNKTLSTIEKIKRFIIVDEPFSIDNAQMTPTMKVRRHVIYKVYGNHIERLYH